MRLSGVRFIVIEEVRNYGKIAFIKNVENIGGGIHTPHPPGCRGLGMYS